MECSSTLTVRHSWINFVNPVENEYRQYSFVALGSAVDYCLLEASLLSWISAVFVYQQIDDEAVTRSRRQMDGLCSHMTISVLA